MSDLKLIALDTDDLQVISAHLQDAVLRVGDMVYLAREKRFVALTNRFNWLKAVAPSSATASMPSPASSPKSGSKSGSNSASHSGPKSGLERRRTAVRFERVLAAKIQGFDPTNKRETLSLLAVTFTPSGHADSPDGDVTLTFSGGAAIRLTVECLEAEMKDLGAAWTAKRSPEHPVIGPVTDPVTGDVGLVEDALAQPGPSPGPTKDNAKT